MESQERTKQNLTAIVTLDEVGIYKGYNSF